MPRLEKTRDQVLVTTGIDGVLSKVGQPPLWNRKVREMRHDPTLAFLRNLFRAPLLASDWTVESDAEEFKSAESDIEQNFIPRRHPLLRNALRGLYDFGWQPFETVWNYNTDAGLLELKKFKPLLQDITDILVDPYGDIRGLRNRPTYLSALGLPMSYEGPWIDLNRDESMVFSHDPEGTNWYGDAVMRAAELPYDSWNDCEQAAQRFDKKLAGAHWVIYYPEGHSRYKGQEEVDNYDIAVDILRSLESSGRVIVPRVVNQAIEDLKDLNEDKLAWKIELLSVAATSEGSFVGRQRYIDSLKCRAMNVPERAVTEGQYGTKADAEAHADFAIDNMQMFQTDVLDQLNDWKVNFLLEVNHGKRFMGHVRLVAAPLSDAKRAQMRQLYLAYFNSQTGSAEEGDRLDWAAFTDELGYPTKQDGPGTPAGPPRIASPASPGQTPPDSQGNADNAAAATLGEYSLIGQRDWMNAVKRIRSILADVQSKSMSRLMAEEMLAAIGVPQPRAAKLLDDAQAGTVDDPDEISAPIVNGSANGHTANGYTAAASGHTNGYTAAASGRLF